MLATTESPNRFALLADLESDPTMSLEDRITLMMGTLEKKIDHLTSLHLETREMAINNYKEIAVLNTKVALLEADNQEMRKELLLVKEIVNKREQQSRELTVRILGMAVSEEEKQDGLKVAIKQAYDRFLKPILSAAKTNGLIETVPQLNNCVEEGYRVGKGVTDAQGITLPPVLVLRLKTKAIKTAIFKTKREVLPTLPPAEKSAGIKKVLLVEDLTVPTLTKMKEMKNDTRVAKVWTMEGSIRFTLVTKPDEMRKVSSVFMPLADLLK